MTILRHNQPPGARFGRLAAMVLFIALSTLAALSADTRQSDATIEPIYSLPFQGQGTMICGWHCYYKDGKWHEGVDFELGAPLVGGHPILAAARGTIKNCPWTASTGYFIVMDHYNGHRTRYIHQNLPGVAANGQVVARGQVIAFEGNDGDTDPDNYFQLHFETRHEATTFSCNYDGTAVDPFGASTYMWKTSPPSMGREQDWSGDGRADILARKYPSGELCLFAGNGNSGWSSYPDPPCGDGLQIGTGWQTFDWLLRPGDWSHDGCDDIVARTPSGLLYIYYGNCATGFIGSSGTVIGSGWGAFNWLLGPGDYSGDGFNDILARKTNGEVCLFAGNGTGAFIPYPDLPCGDGLSIATGKTYFAGLVSPSDFGAGGCADTVGDNSTGSLTLSPGGCNATWGSETNIGSGWDHYDVMLGPGDFSGDICLDILARKYTGAPDFYLFRGNCAGAFGTSSGIGTGWWGFDKLF